MAILKQAAPEVDDQTVAETARTVLNRTGSMSMAQLGQQLSREFQFPLRALLGPRKLSRILTDYFGTSVRISGDSGSEIVSLDQSVGQIGRIKFDPAVWAAFAKPINEECRRWLSTRRPLQFDDIGGGGEQPQERTEVPKEKIPDPNMPREERDKLIVANILAWCEEHGVNAQQLAAIPKDRPPEFSLRGAGRDASSKGVSILRDLVEAIPKDERHNYSLPLNLIGRLLG